MGDLGIKEAARKLGVSQQTLAKYCRLGGVPGVTQDKYGSPWHIPQSSIDILIATKKGDRVLWVKK